MRCGIYKITNIINGHFYVGSTIHLARRWREHRKRSALETKWHLYNAINLYGLENFDFEVLEYCEPIKETLLAREQYYIDTLNPHYNTRKVASSNQGSKCSVPPWNKGVSCSDELKAKISQAVRAGMTPEVVAKAVAVRLANLTPEIRYRLGSGPRGKPGAHTGHTHTEAALQKMSDAKKGIPTGRAPHNKGKKTGPRPEEVGRKISASFKTSAARQAVYEAQCGREWTDEQRQNASEAQHSSTKVADYHEGRIGKTRGNSASGHYGVIWDKDRNKYQVRIRGKLHGRYATLDEAIIRAQEVMAALAAPVQDA